MPTLTPATLSAIAVVLRQQLDALRTDKRVNAIGRQRIMGRTFAEMDAAAEMLRADSTRYNRLADDARACLIEGDAQGYEAAVAEIRAMNDAQREYRRAAGDEFCRRYDAEAPDWAMDRSAAA